MLPLRHLFCNQCFSKCFMRSSLWGVNPHLPGFQCSPGPHRISRSQHLEGDHPNPSYLSTNFLLKSMDTYYIYINMSFKDITILRYSATSSPQTVLPRRHSGMVVAALPKPIALSLLWKEGEGAVAEGPSNLKDEKLVK